MNQDHSQIWIILWTVSSLVFLVFFIFRLGARFVRSKRKYNISILPDAEGEKKSLSRSSPVILQVNLLGVIGMDALNLESIETQLFECNRGILSGNRVKGLLLYFDSPGGSAKDSDAIYRRLKVFKEKTKLPIYAYVDGTCASGGFLAALAADKIYASPSSVIGSIGVTMMMPFFNVYKVLERWEIGVRTFSEGKNKDRLNPFRPWQEGEDSDLKDILSYFYNRFVDIVVKERPQIDRETLVEDYGAKVFSSEEAERRKLIDDGKSDYAHALLSLVQRAGIDQKESYQVIELVKKKAWVKEIMERSPLFTGKLTHQLPMEMHFNAKLSNRIAYLFLN
ncbi:MAG TPA: S49 family peptidase [Chlamydiales bacterium]|nr:S49 family peptidase [Chlamydiales bacterium]